MLIHFTLCIVARQAIRSYHPRPFVSLPRKNALCTVPNVHLVLTQRRSSPLSVVAELIVHVLEPRTGDQSVDKGDAPADSGGPKRTVSLYRAMYDKPMPKPRTSTSQLTPETEVRVMSYFLSLHPPAFCEVQTLTTFVLCCDGSFL